VGTRHGPAPYDGARIGAGDAGSAPEETESTVTESATSSSPRLLVVVTGLPGPGKSTVGDHAAAALGAPVLAHDWAMSGLRLYPVLQAALDTMEPPGHGAVGWSILCALARAQLRRSSSVVLDGVARSPELRQCRAVADDEEATLVVILTECTDVAVHRSRIEGRRRRIPHWYELDGDAVQRPRARFERPEPVDLVLEATDPLDRNVGRLTDLLARVSQ
jgi:predicted kinase